jgi:hypothetical protein
MILLKVSIGWGMENPPRILFVLPPNYYPKAHIAYLQAMGYGVFCMTELRLVMTHAFLGPESMIVFFVPSRNSDVCRLAQKICRKLRAKGKKVGVFSATLDATLFATFYAQGISFCEFNPIESQRIGAVIQRHLPTGLSSQKDFPVAANPQGQGYGRTLVVNKEEAENFGRTIFIDSDRATLAMRGKLTEICQSFRGKVWRDESSLGLLKLLSRFYGQIRTSFIAYNSETHETRILSESHLGAFGDLGGEIGLLHGPETCQALNEYFRRETLDRPTGYLHNALFQKEDMISILLHVGRDQAVSLGVKCAHSNLPHTILRNDIHSAFDLPNNLLLSFIGKLKLLEIYREFYAQSKSFAA